MASLVQRKGQELASLAEVCAPGKEPEEPQVEDGRREDRELSFSGFGQRFLT